jgi:SAM-dependent methyltransferase
MLGYSKAACEPRFETPGRVLDFGCGAGERLLELRTAGWQCAGVEVNAAARDAARRAGLDVRATVSGAAGFEDASFDFVRANHSLEHVVDPRAILTEFRRVLKPDGTLFIGIPTTTSESARVFGPYWWNLTAPYHTFVPSTRGMLALLREEGFSVSRVTTNGDYGSTAGSLQIALNRGTPRLANAGIVFAVRPLLLVGHWLAKLQDLRGVGDRLELTAQRT